MAFHSGCYVHEAFLSSLFQAFLSVPFNQCTINNLENNPCHNRAVVVVVVVIIFKYQRNVPRSHGRSSSHRHTTLIAFIYRTLV